METEFLAPSVAARELLRIREMLLKVGLASSMPMKLHVDNQAAINQNEVRLRP